jgi:lysophospholipase L1-like esterase
VAELHDQYAQITRDVAAECRAPLLDLHRLLSGAASAPLFEPDGIHFIKDGRRRIAAEIYETLCDLASTPQFQSRRPAPDTRRKKS